MSEIVQFFGEFLMFQEAIEHVLRENWKIFSELKTALSNYLLLLGFEVEKLNIYEINDPSMFSIAYSTIDYDRYQYSPFPVLKCSAMFRTQELHFVIFIEAYKDVTIERMNLHYSSGDKIVE